MAATSSLYASGPTLSEIQAGVPTLSEIETKVDEGPGLSTAIESIQRGVQWNGAGSTASITISSVDTSKSFVSFLGERINDDERSHTCFWLDSATTLKMRSYGIWNSWCEGSWEVIEYV